MIKNKKYSLFCSYFREKFQALQQILSPKENGVENLLESNEIRLLFNTTSGDVRHVDKQKAKHSKERHVSKRLTACAVGDTITLKVNGNKLQEEQDTRATVNNIFIQFWSFF